MGLFLKPTRVSFQLCYLIHKKVQYINSTSSISIRLFLLILEAVFSTILKTFRICLVKVFVIVFALVCVLSHATLQIIICAAIVNNKYFVSQKGCYIRCLQNKQRQYMVFSFTLSMKRPIFISRSEECSRDLVNIPIDVLQ